LITFLRQSRLLMGRFRCCQYPPQFYSFWSSISGATDMATDGQRRSETYSRVIPAAQLKTWRSPSPPRPLTRIWDGALARRRLVPGHQICGRGGLDWTDRKWRLSTHQCGFCCCAL